MNKNEQIAYALERMPALLTRVEFTPDLGIDLFFGSALLLLKVGDDKKAIAAKVRSLRRVLEKVA